jgi:TonB-linked SusC/RagA family outer membrane protein
MNVRARQGRLLAIAATLLALCPFGAVMAQTGTIVGKVIDAATKQPVADARLVLPGGIAETQTNASGDYRLANVRAGSIVVAMFRFGYKTKADTVTVVSGQTTTANFQVTATLVTLSELVVTGTAGNQARKAQSALVASVSAADVLKNAPVTSVANLLQSRVPGVALSSSSGTAGTATTIRIRGASSINLSNQPLLFIDGVRINEGSLSSGQSGQSYDRMNDLNPEEIESIEVVKGPAAATLYGADASAGVIQIITKKGLIGSNKFSQSVRIETGTSNPNYTPPDNYGLCTAALVATTSTNPLCRGQAVGFLVHDNPLERVGALRNGNDRLFNWSGRGGGQNYGYSLSFGSDNTQGTLPNNKYSRLNVRTNFNYVANSKLRFELGLGLVQSEAQLPDNDNNVFGWFGGGLLGSPLTRSDAPNAGATQDGWYASGRHYNAIASLQHKLLTHRFTPSLTANFAPVPWFTNRLTGGMDYASDEGRNFSPKNDSLWYGGLTDGGSNAVTTRGAERYTFDYLGNMKRDWSRGLETNLSFGLQVISTRNNFLNSTGIGFITNANTSVSSAATTTGASGFTEQRQFGYLSQLQLGSDDKRFLQIGVRIDKNSSFGTTAPAFVLPKIGGSWAISEESFFDPITRFVNTLRLRAAYGTTGRSPNPGDALTTLVASAYNLTGATGAGVVPGNPGNLSLKPERGSEFEAGFDAGFLHDRVSAEFTYFKKTTKDLIIARPIPPSLGYSSNPLANIGAVLNSGLELVLNVNAVSKPNFGWEIRAGANTLHNELTSLGSGANRVLPFALGNAGRTLVGQQLGVFVSKKIQSIDVANNKVIVSDTLAPVGNLYPTLEWNLTNTITVFKNFTVSGLLDAKRNFIVQNNTAYFRETQIPRSNLRIDVTALSPYERLRHYGDLTPGHPAFVTTAGNAATVSDVIDAYLEPGDFVRLREISATYRLPNSLFRHLGSVNGAGVTLAFQNLKLWTKYSGADPEVNAETGGFSREDFLTLPNPRKTVLRFTLNF